MSNRQGTLKDVARERLQRRAGTGLGDLLQQDAPDTKVPVQHAEVPIDRVALDPKLTFRLFYEPDGLEDLKESILETGDVGQAVGVRSTGVGTRKKYFVFYGTRRYKASVLAGMKTIMVRDYGNLSDAEAALMAWLENESRVSPSMIERAIFIHRLVEEFGMKQAKVARFLGGENKKGLVSEMARAGQALIRLEEHELAELQARGAISWALIQHVLTESDDPKQRAALFRGLLADNTSLDAPRQSKGKRPPPPPVQVRPLKDGQSCVVRWKRSDLAENADTIVHDVHEAWLKTAQALAETLAALERDGVEIGSTSLRLADAMVDALSTAQVPGKGG